MENLKWVYSANEEWWTPDNQFETKEAAIEAGKKDPECIERGCFWVGRNRNIDDDFLTSRVRLFDIESFNESMAEEAGGEEDYAPEDENLDKLDELNELIADFILRNFETTMSWTIEDVEQIILK